MVLVLENGLGKLFNSEEEGCRRFNQPGSNRCIAHDAHFGITVPGIHTIAMAYNSYIFCCNGCYIKCFQVQAGATAYAGCWQPCSS